MAAALRSAALLRTLARIPSRSPSFAAARAAAPSLLHVRLFAQQLPPPTIIAEEYKITGPTGTVPSSFEQAAGLERAELEIPNLFDHNKAILGPFGTAEKPCLIESIYDERIVGCTGLAEPEDHDIMWVKVEKGRQSACPLCEQVFELKQVGGGGHHH